MRDARLLRFQAVPASHGGRPWGAPRRPVPHGHTLLTPQARRGQPPATLRLCPRRALAVSPVPSQQKSAESCAAALSHLPQLQRCTCGHARPDPSNGLRPRPGRVGNWRSGPGDPSLFNVHCVSHERGLRLLGPARDRCRGRCTCVRCPVHDATGTWCPLAALPSQTRTRMRCVLRRRPGPGVAHRPSSVRHCTADARMDSWFVLSSCAELCSCLTLRGTG